MQAPTKFSEDIVALSDMKVNPGRVVSQVGKTGRPSFDQTEDGRGWFFNHLRITKLKRKNWTFLVTLFKD